MGEGGFSRVPWTILLVEMVVFSPSDLADRKLLRTSGPAGFSALGSDQGIAVGLKHWLLPFQPGSMASAETLAN